MAEDIKPPQKYLKATVTRDVIEAAIETVPGAGVVTSLGRNLFPSKEEQDRDRWAGEVTNRVNEHDRVLRPQITITGAAAALARWFTENSPDGYDEPMLDIEHAVEALDGEFTARQIEEGAAELQDFGLVRFDLYLGGNAMIRPKPSLFEAMDKQIKGWDVEEDARALAGLIVDDDGFAAGNLEARSGFERRRFNPALSKLLTYFDHESISRELQPYWPASYAIVNGGTRARLRRFLRDRG